MENEIIDRITKLENEVKPLKEYIERIRSYFRNIELLEPPPRITLESLNRKKND